MSTSSLSVCITVVTSSVESFHLGTNELMDDIIHTIWHSTLPDINLESIKCTIKQNYERAMLQWKGWLLVKLAKKKNEKTSDT